MTISTAVAIGIPAATFVGGIIAFIIRISIKIGKMQQKDEERDKYQKENDKNIKELFDSRNEHANMLVKVSTLLETTAQTCTRIELKLDRRLEGEN